GVLNTTPRGEFTLKKLAGRGLGSERVSGTPSQLISRRMPPKEPFAPATVPPPTAARKASRVGVIEAALGPAASKIVKAARAVAAVMTKASEATAAPCAKRRPPWGGTRSRDMKVLLLM